VSSSSATNAHAIPSTRRKRSTWTDFDASDLLFVCHFQKPANLASWAPFGVGRAEQVDPAAEYGD